jgi:hypothetical protein
MVLPASRAPPQERAGCAARITRGPAGSGAPLSRAQQRADTRRERVEAIAAALDADRQRSGPLAAGSGLAHRCSGNGSGYALEQSVSARRSSAVAFLP